MRTNTRIVIDKVVSSETTDDRYQIREVVGSLTPAVSSVLTAAQVQKLIDERDNSGRKANVVVIRASGHMVV